MLELPRRLAPSASSIDWIALGIGTAQPRISWLVATEAGGWRQSGYELEATDSDGDHREQASRIDSSESVLVPWPFAPLQSRERRSVRVRVWDSEQQASE